MTAAEIIAEVRTRLADTAAPYHWASADLLAALNDGLQALFLARPDCVILDDDTTIRVDRPAALTEEADPLPVADRWRSALVYYVLARAYEDDSDEIAAGEAGKAMQFMARFERETAR